MSGSYSSHLRGGGTGGGLGATTMLAAKVAFASAALAAAACLARVALPQLVSGADGFLWKLCLFVTVHIIIFVIWKLSDNKHFHADTRQHKDPWAPTPYHPAPPLLTEEVVLSAMKRKAEPAPAAAVVRDEQAYRVPPPVSRPHLEAAAAPVDEGVVSPGSCGGDSCVTTESEEEAAAWANVASADRWRSAEPAPAPARKRTVGDPVPAPARERAFVERGISLPPPAATDEHFDVTDEDEDLDATWNAIMQRTRPATAPAPSSSSPPVGGAELSKRSDDFVKKVHHSFGRQQ